MLRTLKFFMIVILMTNAITANNMVVINSTSLQATVTLQSNSKTFTKQAAPDENSYIQPTLDHPVTQFDNPLANFDCGYDQIEKVTINRIGSNMPQIIYYNGEMTSDNVSTPTGIYGTYISRSGVLQILQDSTVINGLAYNIYDLNSFSFKCKALKEKLSQHQNKNEVQLQVNDVDASLKLIERSDKASILGLQLILIRSELDGLVDTLKIIDEVDTYNQTLDDLERNLTADNVDDTQKKLNDMVSGFPVIDQTSEQSIVNPSGMRSKMMNLQDNIDVVKHKLNATKNVMMSDSPIIGQ